ncbi:hypothetical protein SAMN04487859_103128 [Roseovarius lutimaris]|uniref:Uncharacterized protein n=1 Tax=Roseovarius lutimaris TaxID=1005928 RepID=A0A1I4ZE16_9RHOB|nr:hypothetical protein [Roseovarius lutimaris]SFN48110.1 hypothetical protein SAMN04487859_103128 [Roseovarius lutimaris]
MSAISRQYVLRKLQMLCIWFVVITVAIYLYADDNDPMPVSLFDRLLIATGIVVFLSIPFVKKIGRIYLNTTPDDADLDD